MRRLSLIAVVLMLGTSWCVSVRAALVDYRYNSTTQHVYARTDASVTWTAAEAQAVAAGAHLVTINDATENAWVYSNYGSRWIGFNDVAAEGTWVWSSGTGGTFDYNTWSGDSYHNWNNPQDGGGGVEPNNSGGAEHYAQMSTSGYWNDLSASHTLGGIVEFSNTIANTGITSVRYSPVTNKRYALTSASDTWENARVIALYNGGQLATVNDAGENAWLAANMASGGSRWIGFNDVATEGTWVWTDGSTASYMNWNSGEPNDAGTGEDYAQIQSAGGWNDVGETATAQGIVEMSARNLSDYQRFNPANGKLYSQTDNLIWVDAEAQAQHWGGHLATIRNAAENAYVHAQFGSGWIGFNDEASEGTWVWSSGEGGSFDHGTWSGDSYHNWYNPQDGAPGGVEPNNAGSGEDYTTMRGDGYWNDYGGANYQQGVAEKAATAPRWIYNPDTGRWYARTAYLTWEDAEAQAQYWGAHLATINDGTEDAYVAGRFANTWIGFNDVASEGNFVWSSGEAVTYTNWGSGEPNNSGNEDYTQIRTTGWNDYGVRHLDGVAEGDTDAVLGSAEYRDGPTAAVRYAILGQMTWEDAEAAAQALGGHLVTVRGQAENDFLQQLAQELGGNIWLGYNDVAVEGDWVWASGVLSPYTNWSSGEPNNAGSGEDYAAMYYANGLWNDVGSTTMYYAVVEFVPEPGTFLLAAVGFGLVGALGWRRRKR